MDHMGRSIGLLVLFGALAVSVTGCALDGAAIGGDQSTGPGVPATPTPTVPPVVSPTLAPGTIAFQIGCSDLVSDEAIYEWGSGNWAADPDYDVVAGSSAAEIVEFGGTACGWVNLTSGETLSVAVGQFTADTLTTVTEQLAAESDSVSDFGVEGYFTASAGTGKADALRGPYWVSASSTWFGAPSDAVALVQAALDATG